MGFYGNIWIKEAKEITKYENFYEFILYKICSGNYDLYKLCIKYVFDTIKPIEQIVKKCIKKLEMGKYCKFYMNGNIDIEYIQYEGMIIAVFDLKYFQDQIKDDEKALNLLYKESRKLMEEIRKENIIPGIRFDFIDAEHNEEYNGSPAIWFGNYGKNGFVMNTLFFEKFLQDHPMEMKEEKTAEQIIEVKKLLKEKIIEYSKLFNSKSELRDEVIESIVSRAKDFTRYTKNDIKRLQDDFNNPPVNWMSKNDPEYKNLSNAEIIKKYQNKNKKDFDISMKKYNNLLQDYNRLAKGKISTISFKYKETKSGLLFYLDESSFTDEETRFISLSPLCRSMMQLLRNDNEIKKCKIKIGNLYDYLYDKSIKNKEFTERDSKYGEGVIVISI